MITMSRLATDAEAMGVELDADQVKKLLEYVRLLTRWNNAYNLTSSKGEPDLVAIHLLDSLSIAKFITGPTLLDVGAGAGLPGIPLSIVLPEVQVTLLDSRGKKTRFMEHTIRTLKPGNAEVVQSRVEDFSPEQPFKQIVSRAFSSLDKFYSLTKALLKKEGTLLAMKGVIPDHEIAAAQLAGANINAIHTLTVPGIDAQRHVVVMEQGEETM